MLTVATIIMPFLYLLARLIHRDAWPSFATYAYHFEAATRIPLKELQRDL